MFCLSSLFLALFFVCTRSDLGHYNLFGGNKTRLAELDSVSYQNFCPLLIVVRPRLTTNHSFQSNNVTGASFQRKKKPLIFHYFSPFVVDEEPNKEPWGVLFRVQLKNIKRSFLFTLSLGNANCIILKFDLILINE